MSDPIVIFAVLGVLVLLGLLFLRLISDLRRDVTDKVDRLTSQVTGGLQTTTGVVGDVKKTLGELSTAMSQTLNQILDKAKDISRLQEILQPPKLRGGLGELFLERILEQVLPRRDCYTMQYSFPSGETVDAVIHLGTHLVPIDSKFPLESFRRVMEAPTDDDRRAARREFLKTVKGQIDDIRKKYIRPDDGTFDFALMYIPAENVYYETILKEEIAGEDMGLFQYAVEKKVIPVSPMTFYAYLQAIVLGLKGLQIEARAQEILQYLHRLQGEFERFKTEFDKVGSHLSDARNRYEDATKRLERFGEKLIGLELEEGPKLDAPEPPRQETGQA